MRVAVIAHGLRAGGGISVATNIIRSLATLRPDYTYLITAPDLPEYRALPIGPNIAIEFFTHRSYLQRLYFDEITLCRRLKEFQPDLIFSLGNSPARIASGYQVLLIHNSHLVYPSSIVPRRPLIDRLMIWAQKSQLRRGLDFVDLVYCQTRVMRSRFLKTFQYQNAVRLLPNAVSQAILDRSHSAIESTAREQKETLRLLVLTRYYVHKNLESIVTCFERYRQDLPGVEVVLTIEDEQHPRARALLEAIRRNHLESCIKNIGAVPQSDLPALYRKVDGILLPTLLESFSGTYLEAMRFGKPILTSDRDFAHDACGDAALYFDPSSPEAMRDAILQLKNSASLRKGLVEAGYGQLRSLSKTWNEIVSGAIVEIERRISAN